MWRHLKSAWWLARSQKVRFLLTVSGVVVGVGSLVLIASLLQVARGVLEGAARTAKGDDLVVVNNDWGKLWEDPAARALDARDQARLQDSSLLGRTEVTGLGRIDDLKAQHDGREFSVKALGAPPTVWATYALPLASGRVFTREEDEQARNVVVVGAEVDEGRLRPGDAIRIGGRSVLVVGVLENKPEMGPGGEWGWNHRALFPERTFRMTYNPSKDPATLAIKRPIPVDFEGELDGFLDQTRTLVGVVLMRDRDVKSFRIDGAEEDDATGEIVGNVVKLLLYLTTAFSMVVGGINIMNIMLVTVTERTREIGVRRALGASQGEILGQFLAETVFLTLFGAALGLASAVALLGVASWALTTWVLPWPFRIAPWSVVVGIGFSTVVGLVFGLYPAWRASRLDPVEALRFD